MCVMSDAVEEREATVVHRTAMLTMARRLILVKKIPFFCRMAEREMEGSGFSVDVCM